MPVELKFVLCILEHCLVIYKLKGNLSQGGLYIELHFVL